MQSFRCSAVGNDVNDGAAKNATFNMSTFVRANIKYLAKWWNTE
ncbi:unnamed protein product [Larinioides sclopetarius]|uniref:Uncharacterized protein n=1 Tax=Larinioides sclopetarius TaxID=280406 RepID=A0AAV2AZH7_9ARAC